MEIKISSLKKIEAFYIWPIIFIAAFLRFFNLGTESFWFDEIYTVHLVSQDSQAFFQEVLTNGSVTRNAFYYFLVYFWVSPFEMSEVSIRSFSVITGVISIGMIYLVGKELFGTRIGLISAFFMAIAEFQIQYSQDARSYSLFALMTLISMYCYIIASKNNNFWSWLSISVVNVLLFFTHSYAIFIIFAQYVHFFYFIRTHRNAVVSWGIAQLPLLIFIIPSLLPILINNGTANGFEGGLAWITTPSITELIKTIIAYIIPRQHEHSWNFVWLKTIIGLLIFVIGAFFFTYKKLEISQIKDLISQNSLFNINNELFLVLSWFAFPLLIPFAFSLIITPLFVDRYTICAAPAFYILMAFVISRIGQKIPEFISIIALLIIIVPGLQDYYTAHTNEEWREAALFVRENSTKNDIVLFTPDTDGFQHKSFYWYFGNNLPYCGIDEITEDDLELLRFITDCTSGYERFWVVIRGTPTAVSRYDSYFSSKFHDQMILFDRQDFIGIKVLLFEIKPK